MINVENLLSKGGPVMWPLLICSIISLTITCERTWYWMMKGRNGQGPSEERNEEDAAFILIEMNRGLFALDTIITMAPLLGILGTVLGIIDCFGFLSGPSYINPALISSGIGQALISTAAGLTVSLGTLLPYNWFSEKLRKEGMKVMILSGGRL
jgi:biopolymer transport protein ExbB